jgi:hypothetical protein
MADRNALDIAITAYERGFYLKNDYYNGINFAYLLNVRAAASTGDDAVADRVWASRIRMQVIPICETLLKEPELKPAERYWITATMAEACYGVGDQTRYENLMADARAIAPESWMVTSTLEQIAKLKDLLLNAATGGGSIT